MCAFLDNAEICFEWKISLFLACDSYSVVNVYRRLGGNIRLQHEGSSQKTGIFTVSEL